MLQAFLGHVSLADTAYYLHLTADLFPDIVKKVETAFSFIIPETQTGGDVLFVPRPGPDTQEEGGR